MDDKQKSLTILFGEDGFSIKQSLELIRRNIGQDSADNNTNLIDGSTITPEELGVVCTTVPFLSAKRLVVINGLLERFEIKNRAPSPRKSSRGSSQPKSHESFIKSLSKLPDTSVVVLVDGKISPGNPLFKELSPKAVVKSFPLLRGNYLNDWVQKRVILRGGKITFNEVKLLARLVGSDLWAMANEIDKLVSYAAGRPITQEIILQITSHANEASIFVMIDAILDGKAKIAQELLQQQLQRGAVPQQLMTTFSWQMQRVVRTRELLSQKVSPAEIQTTLNIQDFALQRTLDQARRFPLEKIKFVYRNLLETDLAIKTGKLDGDLAMNMLIAELCR